MEEDIKTEYLKLGKKARKHLFFTCPPIGGYYTANIVDEEEGRKFAEMLEELAKLE